MLDHLLAFLVLVAIPAHGVWRSMPDLAVSETKSQRYQRTIVLVALLLCILSVDWLLNVRTGAMLGLAAPTSVPALIGLLVSGALLLLLTIVGIKHSRNPKAANKDRAKLLPGTKSELRLFLVLAVAVGVGWELLYRGFLIFYLVPLTGIYGAVLLTATAYGVAHGFKSKAQFIGSILSAFAFTIGYVVSHSLWWLMLLHLGLPIVSLLALPKRMAAAPSTATS